MVSAIILNYLNPKLTAKSVNRLLESAGEADVRVEIIVVDNSAPQTADELRDLLPDSVIIIENEENLGFSKANNQGIDRATGEVILVMNNDLFINAEVLQTGLEYVTSHKNTGVWAPKLIDQFDNVQRSCAQFPTLKGIISEYLFKYQWGNRIALTANEADHPIPVDTVMGACMFIRKEVLEEAGLFDEDYFFSTEDVDLCYKIKKLEYEVVFDPRCKAVHLYSASQNHTWYDDPYMHESRKIFFEKHFNPFIATSARFFINTGIIARKLKHRFD